ncbi:MAG: hypothetical protein CL535_18820 [Ahrensia sp.]|nr:hypothetical protein [Ahrensia sp.]
MTDPKSAKRRSRYLALLKNGPARLRETGADGVILLEFPGSRSVRCAATDIEAMRRDGHVVMRNSGEGEELAVTEQGQAALRRHETGEFANQHRDLRRMRMGSGHVEAVVTVNDAESPLAALARLRRTNGAAWLDRIELAAGERLRADFEKAMLQPRVTASWDLSLVARSGSHGRNPGADLADSAMAARDRVNAAVEAVGPDLGGALIDVCCFLKGLEQVERERAWPRRSAKLMLKTALGLLDRHYHPQPAASRRSRRILHWGSGDFRPSLKG